MFDATSGDHSRLDRPLNESLPGRGVTIASICAVSQLGQSRRFKREVGMTASPHDRIYPAVIRSSESCRYCCKSPKLPGVNFPAVKKSDRRPPIDVASITLPGSPASFSSDDEVPHIFTWKSPVQPKEILIASAKRLLQQNLPQGDIGGRSKQPR